jgi:hypothetical protein
MKPAQLRANMKADIRQSIKGGEGGKGFLSVKQISEYTGVGINHIGRYMEGYEYVLLGRRHAFPIDSVVDRILKDAVMS